MYKYYILTLFQSIQLFAQFFYMTDLYCIAIDYPEIVKLLTFSHKICKFYEKLCLIFGYGLLPNKGVFVCGCFYFCAVYKNGFT